MLEKKLSETSIIAKVATTMESVMCASVSSQFVRMKLSCKMRNRRPVLVRTIPVFSNQPPSMKLKIMWSRFRHWNSDLHVNAIYHKLHLHVHKVSRGCFFHQKIELCFIVYVMLVLMTFLAIAFYVGPRYGHRNVVVYIALCSAVGSLTVMGCKGLGLAIKETLTGQTNELGNWLTWAFLITVVICITVQMNYLNKALDLFNTGIVTPVYYVLFTTLVITASTILFREWQHLSNQDIVGNFCGFFTVIIAILLLNAFRDMDVSLSDVQGMLRPKRELIIPHRESKRGFHSDEEGLIRSSGGRTASYGSPGLTQSI